jgi:hypothetical protein
MVSRENNPLLCPGATRLLQEEILAAVAELHRLRKELDDKSAAAGGDAGGERLRLPHPGLDFFLRRAESG